MINIIQNFLDVDVVNYITNKYEQSKGHPVFEINEMARWPSSLYEGNFGPVYILPLFNELKDYFNPKFANSPQFANHSMSACFLHIWQPGSGINWHQDSVDINNPRIGLTVYLNNEWSTNWGGLMLWEKDGITGWYNPHFNSSVWFEGPFWHSVSIISRAAPYPRLSLQIFMDKNENSK